MSCKIEYATAPNGEVSKLFGQLVRLTNDQEKAFKMYLDAMDTNWNDADLNDQGEATLSALEEAGFFNTYDLVRFQKGPSTYNQVKTQDEVAEHVVQQLEGGIDFLEKQLNAGLSEAERNNITSQIRKLRRDIQRIRKGASEGSGVGRVRQAANRHFQWVDSLTDGAHPRMLLLGYRMVDKMWNTNNTYQFLDSKQRTDDTDDYKKAFSEIGKRADKRVDKLVDITLDSIEDYIESEIGRPVSREELTRLEDIGTFKQNLYNVSHVDEKITQFIREVTINASRKEDSTIQDLQSKLQDFDDDIEDPQVILREDENGNKLPELISPYSKKYYEKRSEIKTEYHNTIEQAKEEGPDESRRMRKRARKKIYKDLNEIEILINPKRLSENTDEFTDEEEQYKQELIDQGIDKRRVKYALEQAKKNLAEYRERERSHLDYIKSMMADGLTQDQLNEVGEDATPQQWKDLQMSKWRRNNSPFLYYEDRIDNDSVNYVYNTGYNHTNSLPKPDADNYSDAWKNLSKREREFWHYYTSTINKVSSWLPTDVTRGMNETFLPKVKKSAIEQFRFNGAYYAGKRLVSDFMNSIRNMEANDQLIPETEEGDEIDTTAFGSPADRDRVPVKFIQHPYHNKKQYLERQLEEGEITKEEYQEQLNKDLSLDPIKTLQMFTAMGLNYKNMTDVSAVSELAYAMIEKANTVNENGDVVSRSGPAKLAEKVKEEINHLVYGVSRKQNEGESSYFDNITTNPLNSFSDRRKKLELQNQRDELEEQFEEGEISAEEYNKKLNKLEKEYSKLGGKPLVWAKVIDNSLLPYAQMKGMGFNVFAGVRNIAHALVGGMIHAAGGQEFTDRDFMNAFGIFMKDQAKRRKKVDALMSNFSILFETAEVKWGQDREFDGVDPYIIQNRTEFVGQGITMIASMLNETVTDLEGNERSLWEAYDNDGNWKEDEFGGANEWNPGNQLEGVEQGEAFVDFRNKVIQLNNSIHGDYARDSNQRWKKFVLGRLTSMFRTWIPELVAYRWQKTRYDQHLGREVTGTYRDTFRSIRDNGVGKTLKTMLGAIPYVNPETQISDSQAANIRRVAREMQLMLSLAAAITALSATGDEDEDMTSAKKIVLNNLIMVNQDISLWMNPSAQIDLAKNPVPATQVWLDYENAMYQTYEALTNEDFQGDNPVWKWNKALPVTKQLNSVKWMDERVLNE